MTASLQPSTELLEDLCTRFILNVPAEELECVAIWNALSDCPLSVYV